MLAKEESQEMSTPTASTLGPNTKQPLREQDKVVVTAGPEGSAGRSHRAGNYPRAAVSQHPSLGLLNKRMKDGTMRLSLPCRGPKRPLSSWELSFSI